MKKNITFRATVNQMSDDQEKELRIYLDQLLTQLVQTALEGKVHPKPAANEIPNAAQSPSIKRR